MGHTMPTVIEAEKQQAMLDTFRAGIRALGLDGDKSIGAAKGDIKLTANGPMIGEIAARLSGGYMSGWTYPYSSGVEPIRAAILAAMGRKPDALVPSKTWTCAERAFISIPGTVKEIYGVEKAHPQPFVNDLFMRIAQGVKVSFPENNVTKCGNVIASAPDRDSAIKAAETAASSILIKLDPRDRQTAEFLSNSGAAFPPDAFLLNDELKAALAQIPDFPLKKTENSVNYSICLFSAFTSSGLKDYMGRTIEQNLEAVRLLTGFSLPLTGKNAENSIGRSFWAAFIRGAYQGAVYYIEDLGLNEKDQHI
jgi:hypothetical protein